MRPHRRQPTRLRVPGILQARTLEWVAISFSNARKWKVKGSRSVVSDSSRPHGLQPTRLLHPWGFPGKSTGEGCHRLLPIPLLGIHKRCPSVNSAKVEKTLLRVTNTQTQVSVFLMLYAPLPSWFPYRPKSTSRTHEEKFSVSHPLSPNSNTALTSWSLKNSQAEPITFTVLVSFTMHLLHCLFLLPQGVTLYLVSASKD